MAHTSRNIARRFVLFAHSPFGAPNALFLAVKVSTLCNKNFHQIPIFILYCFAHNLLENASIGIFFSVPTLCTTAVAQSSHSRRTLSITKLYVEQKRARYQRKTIFP